MLLLIIIGLLIISPLQELRKELRVEDTLELKNTETSVVIDNFFGRIEVKKGSGKNLTYKVLKTFEGASQPDLEKAAREVQLKVLRRNDSIIFFVDAPFICSKWNGCFDRRGNWNDPSYDFKFDFAVELPASLNLDVSTINEGDVYIEGMEGNIKARNVNGHVDLKGVRSVANASTVNGDVHVNYRDIPYSDGSFHTINGTINLYCAKELNAVVTAKSMHGDLFTNFDFEQLKPQLIRQVSEDKTTYKLEETLGIEIGRNGPTLSCETLNGNIYLRKL